MTRIAIIRRNGLGDLLSVMPLVALCKEKFTDCHITLFIDERSAPLVPYLSGIDQTVVFSSAANKYLSLVQAAWSQRKEPFDMAISARPTPMKMLNLFLRLLRAKERIAYVNEAWHSRLVNQPRVYDPEEKRHQMVKGLRLLDPSFEQVPSRLRPQIRVTPSLQFEKKCVMVSVTNNRIGSMLDLDKTVKILNCLFEQKDFQVVVSCEPHDLLKANDLATRLQMQTQVVATETLAQFLGVLASVDLLFIGDGGIMHLAATLDKHQVVLFGGTAVWEWAPLSDKAICLGDPHNVNFIPEQEIQAALETIL
jgi:ADP-heptose:LPS heptosyltransferase